jgi:hypothetical protein
MAAKWMRNPYGVNKCIRENSLKVPRRSLFICVARDSYLIEHSNDFLQAAKEFNNFHRIQKHPIKIIRYLKVTNFQRILFYIHNLI